MDREFHFLSCDWGTSHFRLRWIAQGRVRREYQDENGCKKILELGRKDPHLSRWYENQLRSALTNWKALPDETRNLPLLISGMASSTIGWFELPYARAPIPLDGATLHIEPLSWQAPGWIGETYLISGVATDTNMMRGEETEAIGLLNTLPQKPASALLILPGTHSKHLAIENGLLRTINTYMTGELYEALTRHTVLAASVSAAGELDKTGFRLGVEHARQSGLASNLFLTRTRQVLGKRPASENASFLSGLLIGAELHEALRSHPNASLLVGGSKKLRDLYAAALESLGATNWSCFSDEQCQNAVPLGHAVILKRLRT